MIVFRKGSELSNQSTFHLNWQSCGTVTIEPVGNMLSKILIACALTATVLGCADHSNHFAHPHARRDIPQSEADPGRDANDWTYEVSSNWGFINSSKSAQTGNVNNHTFASMLVHLLTLGRDRICPLPERHSASSHRPDLRSGFLQGA